MSYPKNENTMYLATSFDNELKDHMREIKGKGKSRSRLLKQNVNNCKSRLGTK